MKNNKYDVLLIIIIGYACLIFETLIPSYILFLLYIKVMLRNTLTISVISIGSLLIAFVDFKNAIQFFCLASFIFVIGQAFINDNDIFEKYFSIIQLGFILFFVVIGSPDPAFAGSWIDIFTGYGRLGFIFNEYSLNPNILAMLSAIAFVYMLRVNNYYLALPHLLIVFLTQSRGALVFIICVLFLTKIKTIKSFLGLCVLITVFSFGLYFSPLWEPLANRFIHDGGSARGEIWTHYILAIKNHFPWPSSRDDFFYIARVYGPLDNLYLMAMIRFGIIGLIFCIILLFNSIRRYFLSYDKFYPAFCFSFMIYGLVESGPIHNFVYALTFSMAYNYRLKNIQAS